MLEEELSLHRTQNLMIVQQVSNRLFKMTGFVPHIAGFRRAPVKDLIFLFFDPALSDD